MIRLLCPPTYFDVIYSINPWMDAAVPVDKHLARRQWDEFMLALQALGERVLIIDAQPGLPDMTFAGDSGVVFGNTFIPSNFRAPERAPESAFYELWFRERGWSIQRIPKGVIFEGLGDVVFHGQDALIGHGVRTDPASISYLQDYIPTLNVRGDVRIVDDRYFHLAMAFGYIDCDSVVYYPPAFDEASQNTIRRLYRHAIALSDVDANEYFACNNLVIGRTVLLDECTPSLERALGQLGYSVRRAPMSEFKKSGGSLRCLVLSFFGPEHAEGVPL